MFASDDSVWEDCREALRLAIRRWFHRDITNGEWLSVKPANDPPDGGFSADWDVWKRALNEARNTLITYGYRLHEIGDQEAKDTVKAVLTASNRLLYDKITQRRLVRTARVAA